VAAVAIVMCAMVAAAGSAGAAEDGVVCRAQYKTSNNCYRLYRTAGVARGLVVLLPYFGSDANEFQSAKLPELLAKKNVATMAVSAAGYIGDDDLATVKALIGEVEGELKIGAGGLVVGGVSAGGTGAVRYAEMCAAGKCDARMTPVAVFSVDAPLDFEGWWNRETLNVKRGDPKSAVEESQGILEALGGVLAGSPTEARAAYREHSPFLASEKDGGNAHLLKDMPVRLYTEPDVNWNIENVGRDYYTMNALDQAAMILELKALGDKRAALITTTGKGYRPTGKRNPHSWTIVDEGNLAEWIEGNLGE
jgi:hypothetical protein